MNGPGARTLNGTSGSAHTRRSGCSPYQRYQRRDDPHTAERDSHDEEHRPDDPERGDTEEVAESPEPHDLAPRSEAPERQERRKPPERQRPVEGNQAGQRAGRHDNL